MIGYVNRVIDHSLVDGPGNRTAIFFQGCQFNCRYCHNPETLHRCVGCGRCEAVCPVGALHLENGKMHWNAALCCGCDACIKACPNTSSPKITEYTPEALAEKVKANMPFIRGITCSGGECTMQAEFMAALFALTKPMGLSNLIDSNGTMDFAQNQWLLENADGVMLDIKCFDEEQHKMLTGQSNRMVLQNAVWLAERGLLPEVRTVIVPGLLPNEDTVDRVSRLLAPYQKAAPIRYKIIAYRPMGVRSEYSHYPTPTKAELAALKAAAEQNGMKTVVTV